jgi:hypothetical protein
MSGLDLEQGGERKALVGLMNATRKLKPALSPQLLTRRQAARRLRVSMTELRLRIASGELDTVRVGRREMIFL